MSYSSQLENSTLVQLVYVSVAMPEIDQAAIRTLTHQSAKHNLRAGITGLLLFKDGNFMQLIEGPEAEIDALYGRIVADPRHHTVTKLFKTAIAERGFPEWSMAYSDIGAPLIRNNPAFNTYLLTSLIGPEFGGMPTKAKMLLQTFRHTVA